MTSFIDGPAKGEHLSLKRAVKFLRAVVTAGGKWDALDQPTDEPREDEQCIAYRLHAYHGNCHIYAPRGGSGFYPIAEYTLCEEQPDQATMRDAVLWEAWCFSQQHKNKHETVSRPTQPPTQ